MAFYEGRVFSRIYFVASGAIAIMLFLICIVSLSTFAIKYQAVKQLPDFQDGRPSCVLFGTFVRREDDITVIITLSGPGPCNYVLTAQSLLIVMAVGVLIYNIVLAIMATDLLSFMRITDVIIYFFGFVLSFSMAITLTAGVNKTCTAFQASISQCPAVRFFGDPTTEDDDVFFYNGIRHSLNSAWFACILIFVLGVWNGFLLLAHIFWGRNRKKSQNTTTDPAPEKSSSAAI